LENTKWLQYISGLLKASSIVVNAIDKDRRPVLVHCSDGWDRTPQIVALAELLLDPYYRTVEVRVTVLPFWFIYSRYLHSIVLCRHPYSNTILVVIRVL